MHSMPRPVVTEDCRQELLAVLSANSKAFVLHRDPAYSQLDQRGAVHIASKYRTHTISGSLVAQKRYVLVPRGDIL
jgi:hypothetical protein